VKRSVRRDKRQWVDEQAQRAEVAERRGDVKKIVQHHEQIVKERF
jgi:hypothetical protein